MEFKPHRRLSLHYTFVVVCRLNEYGRGGPSGGPAHHIIYVPQFWQQESVREAAEDNHSGTLWGWPVRVWTGENPPLSMFFANDRCGE